MKGNRLVYGVGINDANYLVQKYEYLGKVNGKHKNKLIWLCPYYDRWKGMLRRCYAKEKLNKSPTYVGCTVCEEWLIFSNFKSWMEKQDWEGRHLDKDILFPGNKVYSPETCVFVEKSVNSFLTDRKLHRGGWPIGALLQRRTGKFMGQCNDGTGKHLSLGIFDTPEEAHEAWRKKKLELARNLAEKQTDPRVSEALINRYLNYKES